MILHHLRDLAGLVAALAIMTLALAGWGRLMARFIGLPGQGAVSTFDIWLGFATIIGLVGLLHLVFPVDWRLTLALTLIGFFALFLYDRIEWLAPLCALLALVRKHPWATAAVLLLFFVWCSRDMRSPGNYDSGLYHFQSIRWLNEHAIVRGLGNLHGRLAFNQSYFGFLALTNFSPFWNRGYAAGGLFLFLLTLASVHDAKLPQYRAGWWVYVFLMFALVSQAHKMSSPTPDLAVALLQAVIFLLLLKICLRAEYEDRPSIHFAALLFILCVVIVTIKLSAAMFALTSLIIAVPMLYRTIVERWRVSLRVLGICMFLGIVHIARGYLYSGTPLYPSTFAGAWDLDWAMPIEAVRSEASWIYSFARSPGMSPENVLGSWAWLGPWLKSLSFFSWATSVSICALVVSSLRPARVVGSSPKVAGDKLRVLYIPLSSALVFWFMTAPDSRFLGVLPQLFAVLAFWILARRRAQRLKFIHDLSVMRNAPEIAFAVLILYALAEAGSLSISGWESVRATRTETRLTDSAMRVHVPIKGDQCWNAPLPCTPYFNPRVTAETSQDGEALLGIYVRDNLSLTSDGLSQ